MPALIDRLFSKTQVEAIQKLWADKDSRSLLEREIGKKLLDTKEFVDEFSLTQLMFITSLSSFASSPDECYDIAGIIYWGINRTDIIPLVTKHNNKELAYRCLISLGFFRGILNERCKRYGAPSPAFYRKIGIQSFEIMGREDIGKHFYQWENFMGEIFI